MFPYPLLIPLPAFLCPRRLFTMFDKLCDHHKVQKVETAGDCYIVAGGILRPDEAVQFWRLAVQTRFRSSFQARNMVSSPNIYSTDSAEMLRAKTV